MANFGGGFIAGSIVGKLLLDKSGWNQSIRDVDKDKNKLKGTVGQIGSSFMKMSKIILLAGAGATSALVAMTKKTATAGDEIAKLSKRVGISAETLSGYGHAAKLGGSSLEGFAAGARRLSSAMMDTQNGLLESKRAFDSLGISVADSTGQLRPMDDVLMEVADRFSEMADGTAKAALSQDIFGRSGMALIPMLNEGSEGLKRHREEAERLGIVFTDKAAKASEEFNDSMTRLKASVEGTSRALAIELMPIMTDITNRLTNFMVSVKDAITKNAQGIATGVLQAFKIVVQAIEGVMLAFNALKLAVFKVGEAIVQALVKRLIPIAVVVDALAKKFSILKGTSDALFEAIKNLVWIGVEYQEQSDKSLETMSDIVGTFEKLLEAVGKIGDEFSGTGKKIGKDFVPTLGTVKKTLEETEVLIAKDFSYALKHATTYLIRVRDYTGKLNRELELSREHFRRLAEVMETDASAAFLTFYNTLQLGLNLLFMTRGGPSFPFFKRIEKGIFDVQELWKNMNQQIEAEWIRGISKLVTAFSSFRDALAGIAQNILTIFGDTIGMIVVAWVKGTITMQAAVEGIKMALKALAVFIMVDWTKKFLTWVGILKEKVDPAIQAILDKLEKAREEGEKIWELINKIQLKQGDGGTPRRSDKTRQGEDYNDWLRGDLGQYISKIPAGLKSMIEFQKSPQALMRIGRIARASIGMMISQGYTLFQALTALKEPLTMLRDKYLELGRSAPAALQPMLDMIEKMEKRPKLFEAMSGLMDVFNAFVKSGWMTQSLFKDLTAGAQGFVRQILGVTGNLRKAIGDLGSLSKEQIMMLAPILVPFLEAAQKFGLKLPAWIADLAKKAGIKIEEQPIAKVPGLLEDIHKRLFNQATRIVLAIRGLGAKFEKALGNIPSGAGGLDMYSGDQGGLVRYHPREQVSITPGSFNIQMESTPIIVKIGEREIFNVVAKHSVKQGKRGRFKVSTRSLVEA